MNVIELEEAERILTDTIRPFPAVEMPLVEATGLVLAEDVASDVSMPPFDKSAMDGYAVRSEDVRETPAELELIEKIPAGSVPQRKVGKGQCSKIMTGAPVPEGADAVVIVEDTEPSGSRVRVLRPVSKGKNICFLGEDLKDGDAVFKAGTRIGPSEAAVLASVGKARVKVYPRPTAAVLATGNEVVDVTESPGPGRIRNANSYSMAARLAEMGIRAELLGIARDDEKAMREAVERGLRSDVLLISGAVSVGDWDLVPRVLRDAGVSLIFEKIAVKPGKPTVFGRGNGTWVFGVPGNPVSTVVMMELVVVPALRLMMGWTDPSPQSWEAVLEGSLSHKADRRSHKPVHLRFEDGWKATPAEYHGSADIVGFARANAVAVIPAGVKKIEAGAKVTVYPFPKGLQ